MHRVRREAPSREHRTPLGFVPTGSFLVRLTHERKVDTASCLVHTSHSVGREKRKACFEFCAAHLGHTRGGRAGCGAPPHEVSSARVRRTRHVTSFQQMRDQGSTSCDTTAPLRKHYARSIIASFMSGSHTSEKDCSPHLMVSTTDRIARRAQKEEIRPALALPRTGGLWQICAEPWSTAAGSITAHAYDTHYHHSYLLSAPHDTDERDRWQCSPCTAHAHAE